MPYYYLSPVGHRNVSQWNMNVLSWGSYFLSWCYRLTQSEFSFSDRHNLIFRRISCSLEDPRPTSLVRVLLHCSKCYNGPTPAKCYYTYDGRFLLMLLSIDAMNCLSSETVSVIQTEKQIKTITGDPFSRKRN